MNTFLAWAGAIWMLVTKFVNTITLIAIILWFLGPLDGFPIDWLIASVVLTCGAGAILVGEEL